MHQAALGVFILIGRNITTNDVVATFDETYAVVQQEYTLNRNLQLLRGSGVGWTPPVAPQLRVAVTNDGPWSVSDVLAPLMLLLALATFFWPEALLFPVARLARPMVEPHLPYYEVIQRQRMIYNLNLIF